MAGVPELGSEVFGVDPVDIREVSATEEMAVVGGKCQGSDFAHQIRLAKNE